MATRKARSSRTKSGIKSAAPRAVAKARVKMRPSRQAMARAAKPRASKKVVARAAKAEMPASVPNAIGAWHHHLDYTSHDMSGVKRFYTEVLGFKLRMEDAKSGYISIGTTPTTTVGFMAPMPGPPEQWRPPGEPALYFFVKDVDKVHQNLLAKGVSFQQPPTDMPWGHRIAVCKDPEGRMVCLAKDLSRR